MKRLVDEDVIDMTGGRFQLSVLLQKRMREYFMGATTRENRGASSLERAIGEVREGRIWLEDRPAEPKEPKETEEDQVEESEKP